MTARMLADGLLDSAPPMSESTQKKRIGLISLGCPKNQVDSEIMLGELADQGHEIVTDIESAEIIKHACNSFLAMKISFINSIAAICEASGANIDEVVQGMSLDGRIGGRFLQAGIGYGGSCFPKDVSAFIHISDELGYSFDMLKAVEEVNAGQRLRFIKKIEETLWVVGDKTIAVLGLAFKPNTDDMRNAPSIDVIQALLKVVTQRLDIIYEASNVLAPSNIA